MTAQKDDIPKFQTTFTLMKREIYSLRAENKELKDNKYKSTQNSKNKYANIVTEKKESETQTEPILREGESKGYASYGILKFRHIKEKGANAEIAVCFLILKQSATVG